MDVPSHPATMVVHHLDGSRHVGLCHDRADATFRSALPNGQDIDVGHGKGLEKPSCHADTGAHASPTRLRMTTGRTSDTFPIRWAHLSTSFRSTAKVTHVSEQLCVMKETLTPAFARVPKRIGDDAEDAVHGHVFHGEQRLVFFDRDGTGLFPGTLVDEGAAYVGVHVPDAQVDACPKKELHGSRVKHVSAREPDRWRRGRASLRSIRPRRPFADRTRRCRRRPCK